jgi:UDPglucose 6-dehydrogenase
LFDETQNKYDLTALEENLEILNSNRYSGGVIIKSTLEPGTTEKYSKLYNLNLIHNPEFLTTRTALQDFHNQTHIVIGNCKGCDEKIIESVHEFYKLNYPDASISKCTSTESESMKLFVNCFYATKVQFFTELYLLCEKINVNYKIVKDLMLMNGWINPMHTTVPGPDGNISYGGLCFPKDTNALLHFMKINDVPHKVLENVVSERNSMREDNNNIIKNKIE